MRVGRTTFKNKMELINYLCTRFDGTHKPYVIESVTKHYREGEPFWFFGWSNFGGELQEHSVCVMPDEEE